MLYTPEISAKEAFTNATRNLRELASIPSEMLPNFWFLLTLKPTREEAMAEIKKWFSKSPQNSPETQEASAQSPTPESEKQKEEVSKPPQKAEAPLTARQRLFVEEHIMMQLMNKLGSDRQRRKNLFMASRARQDKEWGLVSHFMAEETKTAGLRFTVMRSEEIDPLKEIVRGVARITDWPQKQVAEDIQKFNTLEVIKEVYNQQGKVDHGAVTAVGLAEKKRLETKEVVIYINNLYSLVIKPIYNFKTEENNRVIYLDGFHCELKMVDGGGDFEEAYQAEKESEERVAFAINEIETSLDRMKKLRSRQNISAEDIKTDSWRTWPILDGVSPLFTEKDLQLIRKRLNKYHTSGKISEYMLAQTAGGFEILPASVHTDYLRIKFKRHESNGNKNTYVLQFVFGPLAYLAANNIRENTTTTPPPAGTPEQSLQPPVSN